MLKQHIATIEALVVRDLMSRFGRRNLGFVWAILEPMILTVGVMSVWTMLHGSHIHHVPVLSFVVTGYLPLTVWRHTTGAMTRIVQRNATLLYHRRVTHFDIVLARLFLELTASTVALTTIGFVVIATNLVKPVADWSLTLFGWVAVCCYFGGLSLIISGLTQVWEKSEKFVQPLNYLMLPVSGVFMMTDWLPSWAQDILLWNPSVNCIEIFRAGVLGNDVVAHYYPGYLSGVILSVTVLGLVLVRISRRHVEI